MLCWKRVSEWPARLLGREWEGRRVREGSVNHLCLSFIHVKMCVCVCVCRAEAVRAEGAEEAVRMSWN